MTLLYGAAVLIAIWWVAKLFAGASPQLLAAYMKKGLGAASLALAAFLMMRGRLDMAFLVGGFGAWLMGWAYSHPLAQWTRSWRTSEGQQSAASSAMLEVRLDHDSGRMQGRVIQGRFAGRELDDLQAVELDTLRQDLLAADADGVRLLDAYLDRRFPGRGEHADSDADARRQRPVQPGAMSEQEAYDILGLQPGAGADEIRAAHRALIKRLHPDAGGSGALAARVNEAKDVLLKRHG